MASIPTSVRRVRDAVEARTARVPYRVKLGLVWVAIFVVLAVLFLSYGFDTDFMLEWAPYIIGGTGLTLFVSICSTLLAVLLAVVGALGRLSRNPIFSGVAALYVSLIRGTPLILQIFFVYLAFPQFARFAPDYTQGLFLLSGIWAGILALGVNYGAYMTEIFRAGIQSVGHAQIEAAHALAMSPMQTTRRIVLPQALRLVIPPTGNEFIAMLKDSALVSFIGVTELFFRGSKVGQQNFRAMETLIVAAMMYWLITSIFSFFQARLERKVARGYVRETSHGH
ncbi:MAG TPA: amino acid ABC transporter permease [Actinomycetota bacterium]|nr:amino acid ABC transporter permease [Actinomycetota bacterium]